MLQQRNAVWIPSFVTKGAKPYAAEKRHCKATKTVKKKSQVLIQG